MVFAGGLEGNTIYAFNLVSVIHLGIKGVLLNALAFAAFRLTKVDAADQLAYAQDIETEGNNVGAQRAECFRPLVQINRT